MKRLLSLTLCAILLLCSCNGNTTTAPVQTSQTEEKTSSVAETTTETTVVTTTAKVTTDTTASNKPVLDINTDYNVVEQNSNSFIYNIIDEGICVYGYNGMDNYVVIPEYIDGFQTISVNIPLISEKQIDSLTIPKTVTNITLNDSQENDVKLYYIDNENRQYISVNGVIYTNDGSKLVKFPCANDALEFHVPDSVKETVPILRTMTYIVSISSANGAGRGEMATIICI